MPKQTPTKINNALWRLRQQRQLEQKQVARLLGHKTTDLLSRYERGLQQPGLTNLIKLSLVYQATLLEMFPEHADDCRLELEPILKRMPRLLGQQSIYEELTENVHFCTYARLLEQTAVPSKTDLDLVRKHVTNLMREVSDR